MSGRLNAVERKILGEIYSSSEAMDNLTVLCDEFGGRFVGTPENRGAVEFMVGKFEEYGFENPHLETFKTPGCRVIGSSLEIVAPVKKRVECLTLPMTATGEAEGEVVFVEDGAPVDGEAVNGKVVMANTRGPLVESAKAGAVGFLFMHPWPRMGPPTGCVPTTIPTLGVSYERGSMLKRFIERCGSVRVRMEAECDIFQTESWNVCGEVPGNGRSDEYVMLGGHIDGHEIAHAAFDCGAPCTASTEMGRALNTVRDELDRSVRVVLFSSEEFGCWGSKDYAETHAREMKDMRFTYQLDCTAAGGTQMVTVNNWPELEPFYHRLAEDMNMCIPVEQRPGPGDSRAFHALGIPTGSIIDYRAPGRISLLKTVRHTEYDTLDKIDLRSLREATTIGALSSFRMVNSEEWPAHRRTS